MITVTVQKQGKTVPVRFPCNDAYLFDQLKEIGVNDPLDTMHLVNDCGNEIPGLSALDSTLVNLDFLNFLAKRLDSFLKNELLQFEAALSVMKYTGIKDIINLTYNLQNFTLITDFSDLKKMGKLHYLNVHGMIAPGEAELLDFHEIGRQLLTGKNCITPFGVLFENQLPEEIEFDGITLPQFIYEKCVFNVELSHDGKTEYLYLPTDDITIKKAVNRIGAKGIEECTIDNIESDAIFTNWQAFDEGMATLDVDLYMLNQFSRAVRNFDDKDFDKLEAVAEYAEVHDLKTVSRLAENIGFFLYVPEIQHAESLGKYLIQKSGTYRFDEQLTEFYNYEMFGNYTIGCQDGKFMKCGYVGFDEYVFSLSDIIGDKKPEMTMGGM